MSAKKKEEEPTEKELSYFEQRMQLLGISPESNVVNVLRNEEGKNVLKPVPVFEEKLAQDNTEIGIKIYVVTLDRLRIPFAKEGSRWKKDDYHITRLKVPRVKPNGDVMKYDIPKGQGTYPFFHPSLLEKFEKKIHIENLYLTEGFFKAWKGCMHGMDVVGVSSITHLRDKETGAMHVDIMKLIKACTVKRVIWLTDGDCLNLTGKDITDGMDLYKRPKGFFQSASTFHQLLSDYDGEKWFAHIKSDSFEQEQPKGLDDLLVCANGSEKYVVDDFNTFGKASVYSFKMNISFSLGGLLRYFNLDSVDKFYLYHLEKRQEIKGKEFIWNGTRYRWDEEKSECKIMVPGEAKNYFRVGDQYHEFVFIPNKYQELERTFHRRQKGTIIDDYGKTLVQHIPKYKAFCNVPDHLNYQQVIHSNFNIYAKFEHEPAEEDCTLEDIPNIDAFIKHIFGTGQFDWTHPKTKEKGTIKETDLGYDYIQLLYQKPTQTLPILCLVSRENNTGKSTLGKLLKLIFTANVAIVGNAELADNFNASWASKLLVICDEAKIDKQIVVEKVKSLSTADKIMMNAKGKDHVEIDFFAKFLFLTNNEENFIYASDEDVRYWVRKIPVITNLNVTMLQDMIDEIPAFLSFLNKRKMVTENLHRAWFDPSLIKTEALKRVIQYSMPTIEKELRRHIREKFMDFNIEMLMMTRQAIHQDFFNRKYEVNYLEDVLKDRLKVEPFHKYEFDGKTFDTLEQACIYSKEVKGDEAHAQIQAVKKYHQKRFDYPRWEDKKREGGGIDRIRVEISDNGRPYVFFRKDFLTTQEIDNLIHDPENDYISNQVMNYDAPKILQKEEKELPF